MIAARRTDTPAEEREASGPKEVRAALLAQRRLRGRAFCEAYTQSVDEWLVGLLAKALARAKRSDDAGIALIAVGGCGRRELCPSSDIDLVLVHDGIKRVGVIADALWYPIWDAGMHLDHSVRTPGETVAVIDGDIKSALSLLNGRRVAGEERLAERVVADARRRWALDPRRSLGRLRATMEERWAQHGELAFLLEPDVKLSRGGLRDAEALQAAALAAPFVNEYLDDSRWEAAIDEILALRVALHAVTERRSDRLALDDQDAVARRLGYADAEELLPSVAAAARRISWATDQIWHRANARFDSDRRPRLRSIQSGVALQGDELVLDPRTDPSTDSSVALRLAAVSARTGVSLAPATLARLETDAVGPAEPWPAETRDALIDLLGCGHAAVPVLETLDHLGVLGRYIREWRAVRSKPQRNAYHRFTVDRHLFETAAEAARLTRTVHRPDLLLVGAWLHDLGKGFPGDHTDVGERLILDIAERMGFSAEDVATLALLVREHLLLPETATRRDLSDPATIERVAERVGTIQDLDLLAALTRADSIATGPTSWGPWKATLVDEFVVRTRAFLSGDRQVAPGLSATPGQREMMREGRLKVVADEQRITVVAPDRSGLLAAVAGVLAANGLSVRAATGLSESGMAIEVYDVDLGGRDAPRWERIEAEIAAALGDPDALEERLEKRARSMRMPTRSGAAVPPEPRVLFDNDATPRATIVEVRAPDGVGVLARIARSLMRCGCDVSVVRALTMGREVVDTFYVTDVSAGTKITDPARLDSVERTILDSIPGDP